MVTLFRLPEMRAVMKAAGKCRDALKLIYSGVSNKQLKPQTSCRSVLWRMACAATSWRMKRQSLFFNVA